MKLDIIEIANFSKQQLKNVFNVDYNIIEDNILVKVKDIILNSHNKNYDMIYSFYESVYPVLQNLRNFNLEKIELSEFGFSIEDYSEEYVTDVKSLIALYFIKQFNYNRHMLREELIKIKLKGQLRKLLEDLYN